MFILITLGLLCGLLYFIWKTFEYKHKSEHNNYLRCIDKLKQLEKDYINGKYDFETYKYFKNELLQAFDLPVNYKEELK